MEAEFPDAWAQLRLRAPSVRARSAVEQHTGKIPERSGAIRVLERCECVVLGGHPQRLVHRLRWGGDGKRDAARPDRDQDRAEALLPGAQHGGDLGGVGLAGEPEDADRVGGAIARDSSRQPLWPGPTGGSAGSTLNGSSTPLSASVSTVGSARPGKLSPNGAVESPPETTRQRSRRMATGSSVSALSASTHMLGAYPAGSSGQSHSNGHSPVSAKADARREATARESPRAESLAQ
jgi:hypothetical protein